jgi:hypothetical protein
MAFLYCLIETDTPNGPCKVGVATSLSKRLSGLQCGNWRRLSYAWHEEMDRGLALQVEQNLLIWFRPNPYGGNRTVEQLPSEWLGVTPELLRERAKVVIDAYLPEAA